jgi:adenosylcobyric acid synthase
MEWLQERTRVPTVAIVPLIQHALPEEDTLHHRAEPVVGHVNIALIVYPMRAISMSLILLSTSMGCP